MIKAITERENLAHQAMATWQKFSPTHHLVGQVVKAYASKAADLGSIPAFAVDLFTGRVMPETIKIGTPGATLPGVWRYRVSPGTGRTGVSTL